MISQTLTSSSHHEFAHVILHLEKINETSIEQLAKLITRPVAERLLRSIELVLQRRSAMEGKAERSGGASTPEASAQWPEQLAPSDAIGVTYQTNVQLYLDGRYEKRRYLVRLNGQDKWVSQRTFEVLLKLALCAKQTELGWMSYDKLGMAANYHQTILRVKEDLRTDGIDLEQLLENNRSKQYRLSTPPQNITLDMSMIRRHFSEAGAILNILDEKRSESA